MRPLNLLKDKGFNTLMKTGRPEYKIPSPSTSSRDAKLVFARGRQKVANLLNVSTPRAPLTEL